MTRQYVFADESGNFDFSRNAGASRYFILTTVITLDCAVGERLQTLRRELAWEGLGLATDFHASTDAQAIRDRVFAVIAGFDFRVDVTVLEKAKASPAIRPTDERFYQHAWYYHMKHLAPRVAMAHDELLVVGASLGTRKRRQVFHAAVEDVVRQTSPTVAYRVASWEAVSDPCLQVADYCSWAVQRKWESGDSRSYLLIASKITSEYDLFATGTTLHY